MNFDRKIPSFRAALVELAEANPTDGALAEAYIQPSVVPAAAAIMNNIEVSDPDPARLRLLGNAAALVATNGWLGRGIEAAEIVAAIELMPEPE